MDKTEAPRCRRWSGGDKHSISRASDILRMFFWLTTHMKFSEVQCDDAFSSRAVRKEFNARRNLIGGSEYF